MDLHGGFEDAEVAAQISTGHVENFADAVTKFAPMQVPQIGRAASPLRSFPSDHDSRKSGARARPIRSIDIYLPIDGNDGRAIWFPFPLRERG